jgi:hypothetical protein
MGKAFRAPGVENEAHDERLPSEEKVLEILDCQLVDMAVAPLHRDTTSVAMGSTWPATVITRRKLNSEL